MDRDERRRLAVFALVSLPWWWFAVRDLGPWADAAAIFLPIAIVPVVVQVLVALVRRSARAGVVAASWVLFTAVAIVGPWMPVPTVAPTPPSALRIVASNVLGSNKDVDASTDDLLSAAPDIVVVGEDHEELHARLARRFANAATSEAASARRVGTATTGDVGVYTDLPMRVLPLPASFDPVRTLRVRIDAPTGSFVLYALHLPRPWAFAYSNFQVTPTRYRAIVDGIVRAVTSEPLPVVIAGDLNLVDRMPEYRTITAHLRDAMLASWAGPTSLKWWPLLARIDHVFVERSWCASDAERITVTGSDHRAVAVTVGHCPR